MEKSSKRKCDYRRDLWGSVTVRLKRPVLEDLEAVCERLNLEKSEVARRAIAVGLRSFENIELPG